MIITSGFYKGRKLSAPSEKITRPTLSQVRMGVFNTLYSIMGDFHEKTFLDLFGGSGIMGLEALSRGFKSVTVVEKDKKSAQVIKLNYDKLGLKPNLYICDSLLFLSKNKDIYDVVYIDPPYNSNLYETALNLTLGNIIVLEHTDKFDFSQYKILKEKEYSGKKVTFLLQ